MSGAPFGVLRKGGWLLEKEPSEPFSEPASRRRRRVGETRLLPRVCGGRGREGKMAGCLGLGVLLVLPVLVGSARGQLLGRATGGGRGVVLVSVRVRLGV